MASGTPHTDTTKSLLQHAQRWLSGWAQQHAYESYVTLNEDFDALPVQEVYLPKGRQILLSGLEVNGQCGLLVFCSLKQNVLVWPNGTPSELIEWLSQGMSPSSIAFVYAQAINFLVMAIPLAALDWTCADQHVAPRLAQSIEYLTCVRGFIETAHALPSLETEEALALRARFQLEMPIVWITAENSSALQPASSAKH